MPIDPRTRIGAVHLTVSDLARSVRFYQENVGFHVQWERPGSAGLGAGGEVLLVLHEADVPVRVDRATGLYHFAILVPSRIDLARSLRHFAEMRTTMQGFSDHRVSEALYLADPDGIGIEVYRDRPRGEWPRANGRLQMTTDPLDVESLLREADADARRTGATWEGLPAGTTIGHVHLRVAFLEDTERFYREVLGFDLTLRFGDSALFFSAGDYHHHIAANTWAGVGAPQPPGGAIGLKHFELLLSSHDAVAEVTRRIRAAEVTVDTSDDAPMARDPSGNAFAIKVAA